MDLINRQDAIDAVLDRMDVEKWGRNAKPEEIHWTLEKLPSVKPERKIGKWIDGRPYVNSRWKVCSVCHHSANTPSGDDNYCSYCGSKMEE